VTFLSAAKTDEEAINADAMKVVTNEFKICNGCVAILRAACCNDKCRARRSRRNYRRDRS